MTGLWQVSGKNRLTFSEMIRLDICYVENPSILLDLKILLKTPQAVLSQVFETLHQRRTSRGSGPETARHPEIHPVIKQQS
jgi:lipopolysaccharide/colanic/teichoic acid biosynthesis glycosyltransferase